MLRTIALREFLAETLVVAASAGFLVWYLAAKLALWPWGTCRLLPW